MSTTLRRDVRFHLIPPTDPGAPDVPVDVTLTYDPADPYAVNARFTTGLATEIVWVFDRGLLRRGLRERVGRGDVQVAPMPDRPGSVQLVLMSPNGWAVLAVEEGSLREFLNSTYARVPAGTEMDHVDLDDELVAVLEAGFAEAGGSAR